MKNFNAEMIEKAKGAKSAKELFELAKAEGIDITEDEASGLQPLLQMGRYLAEVCATVGELAEVNEECRNCPYFKYCAAGCRAVALTLTGDKMGVDLSKCLFFKKGYYEKVVRTMGDFRNNTPINV